MTKYIDSVRAALEEMAQKKKMHEGECSEVELDEAQKLFMFKTKAEADKKAKQVNGKVLELKRAMDGNLFAVIVKGRGLTNEEVDLNEGVEEAMDPVNPKAVKKDFKDRKDKDIDNDGDVDDSDEYLHKKRKAISKSKGKNEDEPEGEKGETAKMNPKKEQKVTKEDIQKEALRGRRAPKMTYALVGAKDMKIYSTGSDERDLRLDKRSLEKRFKQPLKLARLKTAQSIGDKVDKSQIKESTIRDRLMSIWEDAAGAKRMKDQNREPMTKDDERSAKKMKDGHGAPNRAGEIGKEADDTDKAERSGPSKKARPNDNMQGDRNVINKIANAYKKLGSGKDM